MSSERAKKQYKSGDYWEKNSEWMEEDQTSKDKDILFAYDTILSEERFNNKKSVRIADIGTGTGATFNTIVERLEQSFSNIRVHADGYDIAQNAINVGREKFPSINFHIEEIENINKKYDIVSFIDVLEHLENPFSAMRNANSISSYMVVRQPLLGGFSMFRHNAYKNQMEGHGHIIFYNFRSFLATASFCGWQPLNSRLVGPWELAESPRSAGLIKRIALKINRPMSSYFMSGFYINGVFKSQKLNET